MVELKEDIEHTEVLYTIVNGKVVFEKTAANN